VTRKIYHNPATIKCCEHCENSNLKDSGDKTFNQKWVQLHESQHRNKSNMKNQGNMYPSKVNNSTIKDLNNSEADEISNNELKK
jgi:hypothetical protein